MVAIPFGLMADLVRDCLAGKQPDPARRFEHNWRRLEDERRLNESAFADRLARLGFADDTALFRTERAQRLCRTFHNHAAAFPADRWEELLTEESVTDWLEKRG